MSLDSFRFIGVLTCNIMKNISVKERSCIKKIDIMHCHKNDFKEKLLDEIVK